MLQKKLSNIKNNINKYYNLFFEEDKIQKEILLDEEDFNLQEKEISKLKKREKIKIFKKNEILKSKNEKLLNLFIKKIKILIKIQELQEKLEQEIKNFKKIKSELKYLILQNKKETDETPYLLIYEISTSENEDIF